MIDMFRLHARVGHGLCGLCVLVASFVGAQAGSDAPVSTSGRVRITEIASPETEAIARIQETFKQPLTARTEGPADVRLASIRPRAGDSARFDVTIYDYGVQKAFELVVDAQGRELSRRISSASLFATPDEIEEARKTIAGDPRWARALLEGASTIYDAMPSITVDATGRRLVNIGIMAASPKARVLLSNEVVSVDLPLRRVVRYASGAPPTSSASLLVCNPPPASGCLSPIGSCPVYHVEWPAPNPVWKLDVRHPDCTTSVQPDGTGLELTNVFYKNELILQRAEVPVLNVKYDGSSGCGPYRDILYYEDCFKATGTDVSPGIRVTSGGTPPSTICEGTLPTDDGNFKGVAIHDQGDALWIVTETSAGWYRYIIEYRLHLDGTIEPIFGFAATANPCTCNVHTHHAYWRFEWAIGGAPGDPGTGWNTIQRLNPQVPGQYDPISLEGKFIRPRIGGDKDLWRIRNPQTGTEYIVRPNAGDGSATGDAYAKGDYWALAWHAFEIDDPNAPIDTTINADSWVNGEALDGSKRVVLWYDVSHKHDANVNNEVCELLGPRLLPVPNCGGDVVFERAAFGCNDSVGMRLDDLDLAGSGSATITIASTTESTPENVVLTESAAKPGRFTGTFPTFTGAPVHGDGKLSVSPLDTLTARYVDASACGTPNVQVVRTSSIDCTVPVLSNVLFSRSSPALISWSTNEPATSVVHYGQGTPGPLTASDPALVTSHRVNLANLAPCTSYAYNVQSSDAATNTASSPGGGGSYAFGSGQQQVYAATDGPLEIPNNSQTGVTSTVFVAQNKVLEDVDAEINVTETYDANLLITLTAPDGTTADLTGYHGGIGHDFTHTVFDDEAPTPISAGTAPFTGSYRPDTPLSAFDGRNAHGTWTLKVVDIDFQGLGTLDSWSLRTNESCPPPSVPPPVPDGSFGSAMHAARLDPTGSAIQVVWDAATCPAAGYHLLYGPLSAVSSYAVGGAKCAIGTSGIASWTGTPPGSLWFIVTAENETGMEGSWGRTSSGGDVGGSAPSGLCGSAARLNTPSCP